LAASFFCAILLRSLPNAAQPVLDAVEKRADGSKGHGVQAKSCSQVALEDIGAFLQAAWGTVRKKQPWRRYSCRFGDRGRQLAALRRWPEAGHPGTADSL
jgi:hypothetical protein